jgi:hypothetical protein
MEHLLQDRTSIIHIQTIIDEHNQSLKEFEYLNICSFLKNSYKLTNIINNNVIGTKPTFFFSGKILNQVAYYFLLLTI